MYINININHTAAELLEGINIPGSLYYSPKLIKNTLPFLSEELRAFSSDKNIEFEFERQLETIKGHRYFQIKFKKMLDVSEKFSGIIAILNDINELKITQQNLIKSREVAEKANLAKSEFLANMSHEIRTPLNGVVGMLSLLLDTTLTEDQKEYALTAKKSAHTLLTVINDILDFSKIEAGKLDFEILDFNLKELVQNTFDMMLFQAKEKDIKLLYEIDKDIPLFLKGASGRLMQILINLLGNAIKFTEIGEVFLKIKLHNETDRDATIYFEVKDTGIGIPEDRMDRLFKPFSQVDSSITRKYGGTGLGLSISQKLTEMMGGEIGVYSEKDMGTTFWFTVTMEKQPEGEITFSDKVSFDLKGIDKEKIRILIAEDNIVNQKVALSMLSKKGFKADVVSNGMEVISALKIISYDLILMDVQMPELDGIETTKIIRNKEKESGKHIPIIAMTAHVFKEDIDKCFNAGMDDYLSKPVNPSVLFSVISKQLTGIEAPENTIIISKDDERIFAPKDLLIRFDYDEEIVKEIIEIFLKNTPLLIENLKQAFQEGDLDKIKYFSHTLKGSSAGIGTKLINLKSAQIEKLSREGKLEDIGLLIKSLEDEEDNFKKLIDNNGFLR